LAELTYNATTISERMWSFFQEIVVSILDGKGILDDFLPQTFVPLLNFMKNDPERFKTLQLSKGTPVEMTC